MLQIDMENVRQVEQMLKELQPNRAARQAPRRDSSAGGEQHPGEHQRAGRSDRAQSRADDFNENVFKTTTRLVRDGTRSSDNLKCDLAGNRKQVELSERSRHERQPPIRRDDGSIFSEEKYLSERLEIRKSHELVRSISPPAEFPDRNSEPRSSRPPTTTPRPTPTQQQPPPAPLAPRDRRQGQVPTSERDFSNWGARVSGGASTSTAPATRHHLKHAAPREATGECLRTKPVPSTATAV